MSSEGSSKLKYEDYNHFIHAFNNSPFLMIIRLKKDTKIVYCGVYCTAKSVRTEEDSYYWEESISS